MYSIQDLQELSGVKAHTIRIWEKRYNLLEPERTATNIRFYSDNDLRKLLNVSTLMNLGLKISKISKLTELEIGEKIEEHLLPEKTDKQTELFINNLISAGITFDTFKFDSTFSSAILRFGLRDTYTKVLLPLLIRIGLMWGKDQIVPAQEHLISNLIKQKLFAGIDGLPLETNPKKKYLLFLPPSENHEIGLLLSYYLLKQAGHRVYYLGANVPISNLNIAIKSAKPDYLVFFTVRNWSTKQLQKVVDDILQKFEKNIILLGSQDTIKDIEGESLMKIHSIDQFESTF
ncbi:MAG: DNA-binding transcriptional MerR regulator [Flavobacteriales bacterium]|jgi:DNA-binding transcriptional MerR regulator|tara:strand:+ start:15173 stop:16039 length:867 start_codon:yes stop_codon:yes gene_type:complete